MNEAERLAKALFDMPTKDIDFTVLDSAAAELRRLSATNAELEEKVKNLEKAFDVLKKTYMDANFWMHK